MPSSASTPEFRPFVTWQGIIDWAQTHYRDRIFNKDEKIPTRPGLLYLVYRGAVRLVGSAIASKSDNPESDAIEKVFLGFVGAGQPLEIVAQSPFNLQVYAHVEDTTVIWMYWEELDNWPHLRREVLEIFRYQHQRKLLWLCILGQKRTTDRLIGFLKLLIQEYGEASDRGYYLPYPLTHAQIASAIGATRVTITRLMGKLRQQGIISIQEEENLICLIV
jgi:Crp-like helix-turn-helix domain